MADPRWLDDREAAAWRGYLQMTAQLTARLNRQLQRASGLSDADYGVLVNLSEATDGRLRAFELCDAMQWEKSRLSHHLTRMEGRGLVRREACTTDARGAHVTLTDEGRTAIKNAAPQHVADVRRNFVDVLTPRQLDTLAEITAAVLARLGGDE